MQRIHFKKDELLFEEGSRSDFVYHLVSGAASVFKNYPSRQAMGFIQPGEYIGEIGVVLSVQRTATVVFTEDSLVEKIPRRAYLEMIADDRHKSMRLLHMVSFRTRALVEQLSDYYQNRDHQGMVGSWGRRLKNRVLVFLEGLLDRLRKKLKFLPNIFREQAPNQVTSGQSEKFFKKGTKILSEGEDSLKVFLIKSGSVDVSRYLGGKNRTIGYVRPGEFLGEIGVLEGLPRSASAHAHTDVVAELIDEDTFYAMLRGSPRIFFEVIDSLTERARSLSKLIDKRTKYYTSDQGLYNVIGSVECIVQLTEHRLTHESERLSQFFSSQSTQGKEMLDVYQKYLKGQATKEEMNAANQHFRNYLKMAGLGALVVLPGAPITIPIAVKLGRALGVNILPQPSIKTDKSAV